MTTDQVNHLIESNAYSGYWVDGRLFNFENAFNKDNMDVSKGWLQIRFLLDWKDWGRGAFFGGSGSFVNFHG